MDDEFELSEEEREAAEWGTWEQEATYGLPLEDPMATEW